MSQRRTRSTNWDEEEKVIDTSDTMDKESEEQAVIQVSLDHEVEEAHITTQMASEKQPLATKLVPLQQSPLISAPQASTSLEMPAQRAKRFASVRSKAKDKQRKNMRRKYEVAMFQLSKKMRELDYKRRMKEHQMLKAKHAMNVVEHELKMKILKKKLEQLENKD